MSTKEWHRRLENRKAETKKTRRNVAYEEKGKAVFLQERAASLSWVQDTINHGESKIRIHDAGVDTRTEPRPKKTLQGGGKSADQRQGRCDVGVPTCETVGLGAKGGVGSALLRGVKGKKR